VFLFVAVVDGELLSASARSASFFSSSFFSFALAAVNAAPEPSSSSSRLRFGTRFRAPTPSETFSCARHMGGTTTFTTFWCRSLVAPVPG